MSFNPSEFVIALSTSETISVHDLSTFEGISSISTGSSMIDFLSDGLQLLSASPEAMNVYGWDPIFLQESISVKWSQVYDVHVFADTKKLLAGSINGNFVEVWGVELVGETTAQKPDDHLASSTANDAEEDCFVPVIQNVRATDEVIPKAKASEAIQAEKFNKPAKSNFNYVKAHDGNTVLNLDLRKFIKTAGQAPGQQHPIPLALNSNTPNTESELIDQMAFRHSSTLSIFSQRLGNTQALLAVWDESNLCQAIEQLAAIRESSVLVDVTRVIILKPQLMTLDHAILLLPLLSELLFETFEEYNDFKLVILALPANSSKWSARALGR